MARQGIAGWLRVLVSVALFGQVLPAAADVVSEQVVVAGAVKTPLTLKVADLKAFPQEGLSRIDVRVLKD
jgi:DMSO/TMAO reductase YedYZ molybdopterin-dependent catalytic subunit